jgi:hypothetical protein
MNDELTSQELISRAVNLLTQQYDSGSDSFFVVVTQGGKDERVANPPQLVVGELHFKAVLPFFIQVIQALCSTLNMHPYVFISRFLLGYFLEEEMRSAAALRDSGLGLDEDDEYEYDEDGDYDEDEIIDDVDGGDPLLVSEEVMEQEGQGDQLLRALVRALTGKKLTRPVFYVTNSQMINVEN